MTKNNRTSERTVDFKSATLDTVRLVLQDAETATMLEELNLRLDESQGFFAEEPVVIDATGLTTAPNWQELIRCLESHQLHPIAVSAEGSVARSALTAGLALVSLSTGPGSKDNPLPTHTASALPDLSLDQAVPVPEAPAAQPAVTPHQAAPTAQEHPDDVHPPAVPTVADTVNSVHETTSSETQWPTLVIERQLRSGQRIYAQKSDLVIIGVVGQGAEIIADGNIHVYGPLRGRAMAGAQGNTQARIFTTELDPELIAIAGVYKVVEEPLPKNQHRKSAIISLEHDHLKIETIR